MLFGFEDLKSLVVDRGLCTGCGTCIGVCPRGCLGVGFVAGWLRPSGNSPCRERLLWRSTEGSSPVRNGTVAVPYSDFCLQFPDTLNVSERRTTGVEDSRTGFETKASMTNTSIRVKSASATARRGKPRRPQSSLRPMRAGGTEKSRGRRGSAGRL